MTELRAVKVLKAKPLKKWVRRQPRRGGGGIPHRDPFLRFNEKWKEADDGCHVWHGALQSRGYGCFSYGGKGKSWLAHKWAYVFIGEKQIPAGMTIDHLCRNRRCVNIDHLRCVTQKENTLAGESPPARNARATHCNRGHSLSGENLRMRADGRRICRTCQARVRSEYERKREKEDAV